MTIQKRIKQIEDNITRIELGQYHELSLSRCADFVCWMKKYKKESNLILDPIIDKITMLFQAGYDPYI